MQIWEEHSTKGFNQFSQTVGKMEQNNTKHVFDCNCQQPRNIKSKQYNNTTVKNYPTKQIFVLTKTNKNNCTSSFKKFHTTSESVSKENNNSKTMYDTCFM